MSAAIEFQNVTKRFGDNRVVDAVTLKIEPGELFFLLGPSGCGKTTLLRCLAGFYTPEEGKILIGGRDVTSLPPEERDTGMVFQSYALWPHMSVRENVAFGLELRKVSKAEIAQRVEDALAMVKMTERADYKPNQLSGGQQQRVALARALVIRPACLLLDEPLSNLDAKLRLEMRTEIRRICKKAGLTAVYVTHDQKEALSIADRLAILDKGKPQQIGTPAEVYENPASPFVYDFLGSANVFRSHGEKAAGFVRPHDIEIVRQTNGEALIGATITHLQAVGPVVRVELARGEKEESIEAELRPEDYRRLKLQIGESVFIRPRNVRMYVEDYAI